MGLLNDIFGDHRVLTAKDPDIQRTIDYMLKTYDAFIEEFRDRGCTTYFVRCCGKDTFDLLYRNGLLHNGNVCIPDMGVVFQSKVEAFDGLLWLRDYLDGHRACRALDAQLF